MPNPLVVVDLATGVAQIGSTTVEVRARPGGALVVGGRVIRPLLFGERWRLLDDVAAGDRSIGATVLAHACEPESVATVTSSTADDEIAEVLALHLAGARPERTVQGFAEQLALLIAAGWTARDVFDAEADLVDLLTEGALGASVGDGWTTILLVPRQAADTSTAEVRSTLERNLLDRLGPAHFDESPMPAGDPVDGLSSTPKELATPFAHPYRPEAGSPPAIGGQPVASSPDDMRHRLPAGPIRTAPVTAPADPRDRADRTVLPAETHPPTEHLDPLAARPDARRSIRVGWPEHQPANAAAIPNQMTSPPTPTPEHPPPVAPRIREAVVSHPEGLASPPGHRTPSRATQVGSGSPVLCDIGVATRTTPAETLRLAGLDTLELADRLGALLDEESDLRGLRR